MKTIARFVMRPSSPGGPVDLMLGAAFKEQRTLKAGLVYEIREVLGDQVLVGVGPSAIGYDPKDSILPVSWMNDVNHILHSSDGKGYHLLTVAEYKDLTSKLG